MTAEPHLPPGVDPTVPSPARIYDYMLGGEHNFQADRDVAGKAMAQVPELRDIVLANRGFHGRAAHWMARRGVRQFLDLGSGLPAVSNTHEIVRKVVPDAHVVYVDIDPMVAAYADTLLDSPANTAVVMADLRDPDGVLSHPGLRSVLDMTRPVALLMTGVLHFIADGSDPWGLVARYVAAVPPGSYLALSHATHDKVPPSSVQAGRDEYARASQQMHFRSRAEIERFFAGLDILPPFEGGAQTLVHLGEWGAEDPESANSDGSRWGYCAVARRP